MNSFFQEMATSLRKIIPIIAEIEPQDSNIPITCINNCILSILDSINSNLSFFTNTNFPQCSVRHFLDEALKSLDEYLNSFRVTVTSISDFERLKNLCITSSLECLENPLRSLIQLVDQVHKQQFS